MNLARGTGRALVAAGTGLAVVGAAQAAVNTRLLRTPLIDTVGSASTPVSILIPARDEAGTISACVSALVGQAAEVVVLDDASSDDTAALALAAGATVVSSAPLAEGWLGKAWACQQLTAAADPRSRILVFVDADVLVEPGGIGAAVHLLTVAGLDIACPFPRQQAVTAAERLVQPLLQWSWLTTLPLRLAERSSRPALTAACGQLMVVRRDALERAGGFSAVRDAVLDDVALVRTIKGSGGRGGVVDGSGIATCRMYRDWTAMSEGYGKSLWAAFGTPSGALTAVVVLALGWILPPLAALFGSRLGLVGYAAGVTSRAIAARRTGARMWPDVLAHPLSISLLIRLIGRSVIARRRGTLTWKGRPVRA